MNIATMTNPTPETARRRAPRRFAEFRISNTLASVCSLTMYSKLLELRAHLGHRSMAHLIRDALLRHAHRVKATKIPTEYQPPTDWQQRAVLQTTIKPESLRYEYEAYTRRYGITMSELIVRCLAEYIANPPKKEPE